MRSIGATGNLRSLCWFQTSLLVFILLVTVCSARYAHYHRADALEPFTLEEYLTGAFSQKGWTGTWITGLKLKQIKIFVCCHFHIFVIDDAFIFRNNSVGDVVKYNATTRTIEPYFEASILVSALQKFHNFDQIQSRKTQVKVD